MFTRAIVKTPCRNMVQGITTSNLGRPDYDLALQQHKGYISALQECSVEVLVLDADEHFPDSTFIEDVCLLTPRCAVITNPGADSRQYEITGVEETVKTLGLPLERIHGTATLEGGDIMMVGDHYYVGLSTRTNVQGVRQLEAILKKYGFSSSAISLDSVLHLKTGVSYLEHNTLLAGGEFLHKPEFQQFRLLKVDTDEACAANAVWINGTVLVSGEFEKTRAMIEDAGYSTIAVDISEFRKLDGGLSCLSLRF